MIISRLSITRIAAVAASVGAMAGAQAALVSSWDYSLTTQFNGTNTFDSGSGRQLQDGRQVSWGADQGASNWGAVFTSTGNSSTNRSGITISDGNGAGAGGNDRTVNPNTGNVVTNDLTSAGIGLGAWITHHNNPISGSFATLLTSQIDSALSLWAKPPGNNGIDPPDTGPSTITFKVFFAETSNSGTCVAASPPGNPCNDIFAMNQLDVFNKQFSFGGDDYYVSIFPIVGNGLGSFTKLGKAVCNAAGAADDCVGFTTVEGQDTTVQFGFAVTGTPVDINVPEPGTLALLASALLGVGFARRRRT